MSDHKQSIYVVPKLNAPDSDIVQKVLLDLHTAASLMNLEIVEEPDQNTILAVAIGGDGTMVYTVKNSLYYNIPVMGFNTGKLGFMTDYSPDRVFDSIASFLNGELREDERILLNSELDSGNILGTDIVRSLNELVISHKYSDHIIKYEIFVDGYSAGEHVSNSLIIATPTGSTAYALNVGGAIMDPSMQILEIISVAALSFTSSMKPLIVSSMSEIVVKISDMREDDIISIKSDGREVKEFSCGNGDIMITSTQEDNKVSLLHNDDWNFFNVLTEKLNWNR